MTLRPAAANAGVVFVRTDIHGQPEVRAHICYTESSVLCTSLRNGRAAVQTVEHLMAALRGMGVDNCIVEVDGPEVPAMDGSAWPFVYMIKQVGIAPTGDLRPYVRILRSVEVREGEKFARLVPAEHPEVWFAIDFPHPAIGYQEVEMRLSPATFEAHISRARTFGFLRDVKELRALGLAQGGSLANAIVLGHHKIINKEGLRYSDEFVRHKVLDSLGDLALVGAPILGRLEAYKSGHTLIGRLLRALLADTLAWQLVTSGASNGGPPDWRPAEVMSPSFAQSLAL